MPAASRYQPAANLPPIDGLSLRHMRVPEDFAAMTEVANSSRIAAGATSLTNVEDMTDAYAHLVNCDLAADAFTVFVEDRLVGYARSFWYEERAGARVYVPICFLEPTWQRRGIGRAMLLSLEARITETAADDPIAPAWFQVRANDADRGNVALLGKAGYAPVRYGYLMVRADLTDIPDSPLPPGLELREVRPEHLRTIFAADQEAFADSWGAWVASKADYEEFERTPMADTKLWRIAWAGDEIAGQVRGFINVEENERYGRRRGWVEHISVRRPWRRQGLAQALIAASLPLLRARGMTEAALSVDTENLSGALRIYERMGFRSISREATYRKSLGQA
jgi:mycothiol synthase